MKNKKLLSLILSIVLISSTSGCGSIQTLVNKQSNSINKVQKWENTELKQYVEKQDDIIKKEEQIYNDLMSKMQNKGKIDAYEKVNYNYDAVAEQLHQLHTDVKSKKYYKLVELHDSETTVYSYNMSFAIMLIALKGNNGWGSLDEVNESQLQDSLEKVKNSKDVYYASKDRMLKTVIYEKAN